MTTDVFVGREPDLTPTRCDRCNSMFTDVRITCSGCGKVKPSCGGCARGWSQVGNASRLGPPEHFCAHCSLSYP